QMRDRDLQRDRVDVERLGGVDAHRVRAGDQVQVLERAQVGEIEDRAEVDVEAVRALAGEHLHAVGQRVYRRRAERRIVWRRARADVARRAGQTRAEHVCP